MSYRTQARTFVETETQFQLGFLPTEQSHPETRTLSTATAASTLEGVRMLLRVDRDIAGRAAAWFAGAEYGQLVRAVATTVRGRRRMVFSGCGATGRLAVLLEAMWRRYWNRIALPQTASKARGIITGGDRALIRSVENFEDYQEFGREQVRELGLDAGDLFIAISEGGETSSVIGSAHQALDDGCTVFFIFNNPAELLRTRIERSRRLINDPRVTAIDLSTGPMALSGSTRMQATTAELLVVGAALEDGIAAAAVSTEATAEPGAADRAAQFTALLDSLDSQTATIADLVDAEAAVYRRSQMVLYETDDLLLDIFGDTTERTPTFSIPPFRRRSDPKERPNPWAVAYNADRSSAQTWRMMLGRDPVGLDWSADTYRRLGAPEFATAPPRLDATEIAEYPVGREVGEHYQAHAGLHLSIGFRREDGRFDIAADDGRLWSLRGVEPASPLDLTAHVAVKLIFNTLSTVTMAKLGRVKGNWMTQVSPTNKKLIDRSIRIVADLLKLSYGDAAERVFGALADRGADTSSLVDEILESG